ncbi:isoprenyl transferase [Paramaledivibacter caminithermalis]|jgi:undecaprenyl diphosphate synthase|uniref:Isoprenyl transferase n=1 Tax=Paramaledivibacter caminithermalis (strain DSM 15212 / CIP 107654 / DViRD3) TaxID=1121301 RepID=A0A1M6N5U7_PARC5|nr:isoprenyl transferase [Paramaledivibacter caminithermalis]SHJ91089.1 Undecaprenyl pyrophosphate synthetase [Paramaledivibacter caminithermalis DSM 15212]
MLKNIMKSNKEKMIVDLDKDKLPKHIAIIMDGNGRWAKKRNLPRIAGHRAGVEALRGVIKTSSDIGIKYLTLYAFSTENWKRPAEEVKGLMELLVLYLRKEIGELHNNNVKINIIGDISKLPSKAISEIDKAVNLTSNNKGLNVNIALNYGGKSDIIHAVKGICENVLDNNLQIEDICEDTFSKYLYTRGIPDPDLLIRTSGEQRISNFLLWQIAYSELWFTKVYWPDFTSEHLIEAIHDFKHRKRRFGGLK